MDTLAHIAQKYNLDLNQVSPIEIPGTRNDMAKLFAELRLTVGVEIGVEKGRYSEVLAKSIPGLQLACVDAWQSYEGYREHVTQEEQDGFFEETKNRLKPFTIDYYREFSMVAVQRFADNSLDFVYIDGNHEFQHVSNDLAEWSKKVRPGGIIAGHDYTLAQNTAINDVVEVVQAFTQAKNIHPWFIWNVESAPSYMWVKEVPNE